MSQGFRLIERPSADMSSVQALMALPRFTMAEGPRGGGDCSIRRHIYPAVI